MPPWKLKDQVVINHLKDRFTNLLPKGTNKKSVGDQQIHPTTNLLKATEEICGISKYGKSLKQTWRWHNSVNGVINKNGDFLRLVKGWCQRRMHFSYKSG